MDLTNIADLQVAMRLAGIKPTKGLGQHFLVDQASLQAVMAAGELVKTDTVLEIGPGLGVMTIPLCKRAGRVIAVEVDPVLGEILERNKLDNLTVITGDVLHLNTTKFPDGYKVVANIPYYLTSKIIRLLIESPNPPGLLSLLIQKEVAQRIVAEPGSMSVLAFSVQYYGKAVITSVVERHKFWPAPRVDSAVLQIRLYPKPAFVADRARLFRLVKAGFGEKRKMLKNSLAGGLNTGMELSTALIADAGLSPTARAQELSIGQWKNLYDQAIKQKLL